MKQPWHQLPNFPLFLPSPTSFTKWWKIFYCSHYASLVIRWKMLKLSCSAGCNLKLTVLSGNRRKLKTKERPTAAINMSNQSIVNFFCYLDGATTWQSSCSFSLGSFLSNPSEIMPGLTIETDHWTMSRSWHSVPPFLSKVVPFDNQLTNRSETVSSQTQISKLL